jgi:hypothetical protein
MFVVKDLFYDLIMDRYFTKLSKLLAIDCHLLQIDELMELLDELEGERRVMELGLRASDTKRRIEISSDLYILKSLVKVQNVKVETWLKDQESTI